MTTQRGLLAELEDRYGAGHIKRAGQDQQAGRAREHRARPHGTACQQEGDPEAQHQDGSQRLRGERHQHGQERQRTIGARLARVGCRQREPDRREGAQRDPQRELVAVLEEAQRPVADVAQRAIEAERVRVVDEPVQRRAERTFDQTERQAGHARPREPLGQQQPAVGSGEVESAEQPRQAPAAGEVQTRDPARRAGGGRGGRLQQRPCAPQQHRRIHEGRAQPAQRCAVENQHAQQRRRGRDPGLGHQHVGRHGQAGDPIRELHGRRARREVPDRQHQPAPQVDDQHRGGRRAPAKQGQRTQREGEIDEVRSHVDSVRRASVRGAAAMMSDFHTDPTQLAGLPAFALTALACPAAALRAALAALHRKVL